MTTNPGLRSNHPRAAAIDRSRGFSEGKKKILIPPPSSVADPSLIPRRVSPPRSNHQPNKISVAKGETVEFVNNKAFPHNVVFDEDNVPAGVNADAISHEDYLNGPGEKVTNKFDVAGTYGYYCEPHQGAGMQGTIVVS